MKASPSRRALKSLGWVSLVLFSALAVAGWWGWRAWTGPGPRSSFGQDKAIHLPIPAGMTLSAAADTLVAHGLLKDRRVLLAGARLTGQDRSLRAGLYRLESGTSPRDLLANLTSGFSVQVKVTIPEGLDVHEIAERVAGQLNFKAELFLAAADSLVEMAATEGRLNPDPGWAASMAGVLQDASALGVRNFHWSEGYLAPDTYFFGAGTGPSAAAAHLVTTQLARLDSLRAGLGITNPQVQNAHELLTLASIVEAEARLAEERTRVAAVYSNRLAKGWRLEADPTVAFILGKKGKRLFYRDLEVDSPFNTYRRAGLPPGPIGAPGFKALEAAARPDSSCQAMYFVSDGQGGHVFSRTIREHEEAVQRFRKIKASERRQGRD